ncbi:MULTISPECIES: hypothetical protein [Rhizobium]|uniref:hypothetical protein n=1 Tax=Rhizobium TaxID=379 RepID=UPI001105B5CD|nr:MULTISPECIES: hypothetical protein [Rhizobium]NYT31073.1 hypothetical protein [Rhizobium sp. WYCCWR 11128]QKK32089.1 hypothetical protein FE844_021965 [Rhizobium indicum]
MQQALIRFLRCGKNISARQNHQILFWTGDLQRFHAFRTALNFFKTGICNLPAFGYKRRTAAKPCFGGNCWGIVQW